MFAHPFCYYRPRCSRKRGHNAAFLKLTMRLHFFKVTKHLILWDDGGKMESKEWDGELCHHPPFHRSYQVVDGLISIVKSTCRGSWCMQCMKLIVDGSLKHFCNSFVHKHRLQFCMTLIAQLSFRKSQTRRIYGAIKISEYFCRKKQRKVIKNFDL